MCQGCCQGNVIGCKIISDHMNVSMLNELLTVLLTTFIASWSIIYFIKKYAEIKKLPPGPWGLPFVGYSPFLTLKPHVKATQLSKIYGNVFSVRLGQKNCVFLNDWKSVKDAFSKDAFNGRPEGLFGGGLVRNEQNVLTESGKFWKEHRRFAFRVFRDLGLGRQTMETNIKDEISFLVKEIDKNSNEPLNINKLLTPSVSNNICYLIFGHRFHYDDPTRKCMDFILEEMDQFFQFTNMVAFSGILIRVMKIVGGSQLKHLLKQFLEFEDLLDDEIANHEKTLIENDITDYFDAFLLEMKAKELQSGPNYFKRDILNSNSRAFFGAGSDTVRTTLEWFLKYISEHQHIQNELHKEIDNVVGSDRLPSWADKELMPFTEAVISETLRLAFAAISVPRSAVEDGTILGHFIPKGTVIIPNFEAIHKDPKVFKNPDEFNPYRFLTDDNKLIKFDELIPFSYGKRNCVGESLARIELFLYVTILMQSYRITVPKGIKQSFDSWLGVTLRPTEVTTLIFEKRKQ